MTAWPTPLGELDGSCRANAPLQRTGSLRSAFPLPDPTARALVIGGAQLIVVAGDPMICVAGGRERWRASPGRVGPPVIAGDRVVAAEGRGARLTARDLASGEPIWTLAGPGWMFQAAQPLANGGVAALRSTGGGAIALVLVTRDGGVIASLPVPHAVAGMATRGEELFVATREDLRSIGPAGELRWRATPGGFGAAVAGDVTTAPLLRAGGSVLLGWSTPSGSVIHEVDPRRKTVRPISRQLAALGHLALTGLGEAETLATAHERTLTHLDASYVVERAHELRAPAVFLVGSPDGTVLVGESHPPAYWASYHQAYELRAYVARFGPDGDIERWQAPGPITAAGVDGAGRLHVISAGVLHTLETQATRQELP